jgi:ubiquitin-protein ligase
MANLRLNKEFRDIMTNPPFGISAGLKQDNLCEWVATLAGPSGTPYDGGIFTLSIIFKKTYPYQPPVITFITPIYHCNINNRGDICLDILKDNWSPALTVDKVLLSISSLLAAPNPDDPLVPDIAHLYKNNRAECERRAREHTIKNAIKK